MPVLPATICRQPGSAFDAPPSMSTPALGLQVDAACAFGLGSERSRANPRLSAVLKSFDEPKVCADDLSCGARLALLVDALCGRTLLRRTTWAQIEADREHPVAPHDHKKHRMDAFSGTRS